MDFRIAPRRRLAVLGPMLLAACALAILPSGGARGGCCASRSAHEATCCGAGAAGCALPPASTPPAASPCCNDFGNGAVEAKALGAIFGRGCCCRHLPPSEGRLDAAVAPPRAEAPLIERIAADFYRDRVPRGPFDLLPALALGVVSSSTLCVRFCVWLK